VAYLVVSRGSGREAVVDPRAAAIDPAASAVSTADEDEAVPAER
jgi:hypothetical protein